MKRFPGLFISPVAKWLASPYYEKIVIDIFFDFEKILKKREKKCVFVPFLTVSYYLIFTPYLNNECINCKHCPQKIEGINKESCIYIYC